MPLSVIELLLECESHLQGVDSPRLSAELLVAEVLGCSRLALVLDRERLVTPEEAVLIRAYVLRRAAGEPIAYILGRKEFYGIDFSVTSDVLIPRPETEHIIEEVERCFKQSSAFRFADLGTGSGILAVTIVKLFSQASGVAVDMSPAALAVAASNAKVHAVSERLDFIRADFTQPIFNESEFDLIVSNPPYVTENEYEVASHEVRDFEPVEALVSGVDGLDHIRAMLPHVFSALKPGGIFMIEIGCSQGEAIKKITSGECSGFGDVTVIKDLAGHDRVVFLRKV